MCASRRCAVTGDHVGVRGSGPAGSRLQWLEGCMLMKDGGKQPRAPAKAPLLTLVVKTERLAEISKMSFS